MPDKQPTLSPTEEDGQIDSAVLALLVYGDSRPWSVDEVEREIGDDTEDSLARLYGAGLIHKLDGFVWASRAAVMADEISQ